MVEYLECSIPFSIQSFEKKPMDYRIELLGTDEQDEQDEQNVRS